MTRLFRSGRPILRALALALIVAAIPLPALAGDTRTPASPGLRASITPVVRGVLSANPAVAKDQSKAAAEPQVKAPVDRSQLESKRFFKSSVGMAVIAIVGAGTAYALYSWRHDRVHPQGR